MKTRVRITSDDTQYNEFRKDEHGYIDGYVRGGNDAPLAVVVLGDRIVLCHLNLLEPYGFISESNTGAL